MGLHARVAALIEIRKEGPKHDDAPRPLDDMRAERLREFRHRRGSSECNPSAAAAIPSSPASINSNDDGVTII